MNEKKALMAPCGLDCFNCEIYEDNLTKDFAEMIHGKYGWPKEEIACKGCRQQDGKHVHLPFVGPSQGIWRFQLSQEIPPTLVVETGASSVHMDLKDVPVRRVELKTGASGSNIIMPEKGVSLLDVEAGAASVRVVVPPTTAARVGVFLLAHSSSR